MGWGMGSAKTHCRFFKACPMRQHPCLSFVVKICMLSAIDFRTAVTIRLGLSLC
jgi:hypothetical protein